MKLFNQFTILPRYLKAFNYAGNRMEETTRNLDRDNHLFEDYWKRECREHPTNQHCLVYCDQLIMPLFHRSNKLDINGLGLVLFVRT